MLPPLHSLFIMSSSSSEENIIINNISFSICTAAIWIEGGRRPWGTRIINIEYCFITWSLSFFTSHNNNTHQQPIILLYGPRLPATQKGQHNNVSHWTHTTIITTNNVSFNGIIIMNWIHMVSQQCHMKRFKYKEGIQSLSSRLPIVGGYTMAVSVVYNGKVVTVILFCGRNLQKKVWEENITVE